MKPTAPPWVRPATPGGAVDFTDFDPNRVHGPKDVGDPIRRQANASPRGAGSDFRESGCGQTVREDRLRKLRTAIRSRPPRHAAQAQQSGSDAPQGKIGVNDDDLIAVLTVLVPFAKDMLRKHGEFLPFAATVGTDGQVGMWGADMGVEKPQATALVEFFTGGLHAHAGTGQIRAARICFNVGARLPGYDGKVDAICCQVEHSGGVAKQIFVPYRKGFLGRMRFDEPVGLPGTPSIFPQPGSGA